MGTWAATVRFEHREDAQAFLAVARLTGAYAMLVLEGGQGHHVTILAEPDTLEKALAQAERGTVTSREPLVGR